MSAVAPVIEPLEKRCLLAAVPPGFVDQSITAGLLNPTALAIAPDGRIFVAQQQGAIRVIRDGNVLPAPFAQLPVSSDGERGLIGIALDPDFASNGQVYVHYVTAGPGNIHNRVSRLTAAGDAAAPGSEQVVLDLPAIGNSAFHVGGAIHFGPDGKLYVAVGDHTVQSTPQAPQQPFGKVLRINPDGSIPADNPFVGHVSGVGQATWALGLRNPFTMGFNAETGQLLINDVGQSMFEEINVGLAGGNYGWPLTEGPTDDSRFRAPLHYYSRDQGCAITGGAFYTPASQAFPPAYRGRYFFADFCSGEIRVLNPATGGVFTFARGAVLPTDMRVGDDGAIYYLSRVPGGGELRRISAVSGARPQAVIFSPGPNATFQGGQTIAFAGFATDAEDGFLGPRRFIWRVDLHHGDHVHNVVPPTINTASGQFTVPRQPHSEGELFYRIRFSVTDSSGLTHSTFRDVWPRFSNVTIRATVPEAELLFDGLPQPTPIQVSLIAGTIRLLEAPATITINGRSFAFRDWSDRGARSHAVIVPDRDMNYVARYEPI